MSAKVKSSGHYSRVGYWLLIAAARAASAGKEILLAAIFGTSQWKDALVAAWTLPALLTGYVGECIGPLLTPLWAAAGAQPRLRRLVLAALALQAGLALVAFCFPAALLRAMAPGLPAPTAHLAAALERWLAANIFLLALQTVAGVWCNAKRVFRWPPAMLLLSTAVVLATAVLTAGRPLPVRLHAIAIAITAGNALAAALVSLPALLALRRRPAAPRRPAIPMALPWRPAALLLLGVATMNLVDWVDRMAASGLPAGSLAALDYSERLVRLLFSLVVAPYTVVAFTRMAESAGTAAWPRQVAGGLRAVLLAAAPVAAGLVAFARLWTRCVLGWGRFNAASIALTAPLVAIRGAALGLDAALYFLLFAAYTRRRPAVKLSVALVIAGLSLPLDFLLTAHVGVAGVAWTHLLSYALGLGWLARRHGSAFPAVAFRPVLRDALLAFTASAAAVCLAWAWLPSPVRAGTAGPVVSWVWLAAAMSAPVAAVALFALPAFSARARPRTLAAPEVQPCAT